MYKIWNFLFGYDYIVWKNSADSNIARVHRGLDGKVWYYRYRLTYVIDKIKDKNEVIWMTCKPEKYLTDESNTSK